jgi:hypothetical protein
MIDQRLVETRLLGGDGAVRFPLLAHQREEGVAALPFAARDVRFRDLQRPHLLAGQEDPLLRGFYSSRCLANAGLEFAEL